MHRLTIHVLISAHLFSFFLSQLLPAYVKTLHDSHQRIKRKIFLRTLNFSITSNR